MMIYRRILIRSLFIAVFVLSPSLYAARRTTDFTQKPDSWFRSDEGRKALNHILSWHSKHGDWPKNKNCASSEFSGNRAKLRATGDKRYENAFLTGFDHILEAQYSNGGWPQYYPLREGYYTHITFNDDFMVRLMVLLRDITTSEDYAFLDKDRLAAAKKSLDRCIDCILKCQRCWNYWPSVGADSEHPDLCKRCIEVIRG